MATLSYDYPVELPSAPTHGRVRVKRNLKLVQTRPQGATIRHRKQPWNLHRCRSVTWRSAASRPLRAGRGRVSARVAVAHRPRNANNLKYPLTVALNEVTPSIHFRLSTFLWLLGHNVRKQEISGLMRNENLTAGYHVVAALVWKQNGHSPTPVD
jgi:hypothetical protein